ncbi:MAG TPA: GntR family transcriptional regulator [Microvirga sp.]|jgi:GntR family transcriptional regulator|nr:GntR family transcriptional regulator [Microvirga sp.]
MAKPPHPHTTPVAALRRRRRAEGAAPGAAPSRSGDGESGSTSKRKARPRPPETPASERRRKRLGISTYRRVAAILRRRISSGEWQKGDRLPALDALVEEFGVGRVTVRHALDLLADEGLVARHRDRRGSFVIGQPLDRRWFTLALDLAELQTHSAAITVSQIESAPWYRALPVSEEEGRQSDAYQRVVHLHHHKDFPHPVALTDLLVDQELYRRIERDAPGNRPILERLAAYHADLGRIQQTFTIGEADIELAHRLGLHESAPIAELRRIVRDSSGTIIYFGHLFFRGELVRLDFSVDLKPPARS